MRTRPLSSRTQTSVAVLSLLGLLSLAACGGSSSGSVAGAAGSPAGIADTGSGLDAQSVPPAGAARDVAGSGSTKTDFSSTRSADLVSGTALIKTGSVALRSADIGRVLTRVYTLVGGVGGDVSSEDSTTDRHGAVVRSALVLRVPVRHFDNTLDDLSKLGTLVDRMRSSKDVTGAVADTNSRVSSAQRAIVTLRLLFHRATRLGDVIRLESELSQREADLEALQAEQRSLRDRTTMSTITMTVERPPVVAHTTHHVATTGFSGGVRQGWHALTSTVVAVGHGIGVVLPIGTVLLVLAAAGLWVGRRFLPGSVRAPEPTAES